MTKRKKKTIKYSSKESKGKAVFFCSPDMVIVILPEAGNSGVLVNQSEASICLLLLFMNDMCIPPKLNLLVLFQFQSSDSDPSLWFMVCKRKLLGDACFVQQRGEIISAQKTSHINTTTKRRGMWSLSAMCVLACQERVAVGNWSFCVYVQHPSSTN